MSLYEALSLLVSMIGTVVTIVIGLRQLRAAPRPVPDAPAAEPTAASETVVGRPRAVTAASLLLYGVAAVQVVVLASFWTYRLLTGAAAAVETGLGLDGATDLLGLGAIGVACGVVGIMVARGRPIGLWLVWALATVGLLVLVLESLVLVPLLIDPGRGTLDPAATITSALYLTLVAVAFLGGGGLLLGRRARGYYRT